MLMSGGVKAHSEAEYECPLYSYQSAYGSVTAVSNRMGGVSLYHLICRNCGSVVRSYVKEPEK